MLLCQLLHPSTSLWVTVILRVHPTNIGYDVQMPKSCINAVISIPSTREGENFYKKSDSSVAHSFGMRNLFRKPLTVLLKKQ
jgi:hypothetical protein